MFQAVFNSITILCCTSIMQYIIRARIKKKKLGSEILEKILKTHLRRPGVILLTAAVVHVYTAVVVPVYLLVPQAESSDYSRQAVRTTHTLMSARVKHTVVSYVVYTMC